jgi:hypothetical protein
MKRFVFVILALVSVSAFAETLTLESGTSGDIRCNKSSLKINTTTRNSISVSCIRACTISVVRNQFVPNAYCVDTVRPEGASSKNCNSYFSFDEAVEVAYEAGEWVLSRKKCDEVIFVNVKRD